MRSKWLYLLWVLFLFAALSLVALYLYERHAYKLLWLVEGVILMGSILSYYFYRRFVKPFRMISGSMQLLKEQDFTTFLRPVDSREANEMIDVFNRMILQLRNERLSVREKNRFLDLLIQASPQGIVIFDYDKRIAEINPAAGKLLKINELDEVIGKTLTEAPLTLSPSLSALKRGESSLIRDNDGAFIRCVYSSFIDQGFDRPFLLIEEVTNEMKRVEKESYERVIRMMSHEVNNSVGAISSTLHVVADIFKQQQGEGKELLEAVEASYERCGNLTQFINNFAQVVRLPAPSLSEVSLNELIRSVDALTRSECTRRQIRLELCPDPADCRVRIDGIQFEQVLVNVVKNAYESIGQEGCIRLIASSSPLSICVDDNGPGLSKQDENRLFTPFYTTKKEGQGIGLMFIREVLTNHRCRYSLSTREGWTRFEILLPLSS
ncbi:PAS domain-containing protein [Parabacteroides sp. OttesenSCG-928-N08]|nr:PAS domain-containing protein [Parabacteroides sp. OttesenSCG-928-N08]